MRLSDSGYEQVTFDEVEANLGCEHLTDEVVHLSYVPKIRLNLYSIYGFVFDPSETIGVAYSTADIKDACPCTELGYTWTTRQPWNKETSKSENKGQGSKTSKG